MSHEFLPPSSARTPETPTDSVVEDSAPTSAQRNKGKEPMDLAAEIRRLEKENQILREIHQPENQQEDMLLHSSADTLPHASEAMLPPTSNTSLDMLQHQLDSLAATIRQFTQGQSKTSTIVPPPPQPVHHTPLPQSAHHAPPPQPTHHAPPPFVIVQPPVPHIPIKHKGPKPFSGKEGTLEQFLFQMEEYLKPYKNAEEDEKLSMLTLSLEGSVLD